MTSMYLYVYLSTFVTRTDGSYHSYVDTRIATPLQLCNCTCFVENCAHAAERARRGNLQRSNYMQDGGSYDYEWLTSSQGS